MAASSSAKITVDDVLLKRFFYCPSFEIYGGVGGLYDFGPPGCALKSNIIDYWRQHFILTENMLQVECTCVTPEVVLKASGHVDRFTDYMVRDEKGECYRADKYLEEVLDKKIKEATDGKQDTSALHHDRNHAGAMNKEQLQIAFTKWDIRTPGGQKFTEPFAFNLMFKTEIGPTGKFVGFLRPETAQGIFVNFRRLLEFNAGKMPFAVAQIGLAFRNEIAPRAGLLRVREFPMAEIEHFVNPKDKSHPRFASISNEILRLYAQSDQESDSKPREMTAGDAVKNKVINNETLAYYMTRTQLFLLAIGIRREKLRFRQHLKDEMAHYATDCWDAEIFMDQYGWVECVGHADRSAYDLKRHTEDSKVELIAQEVYSEPKIIQATIVKANAAKIGKAFKKPGQVLLEYFKTLSNEDAAKLKTDLLNGPTTVKVGEHEFKVEPDMVDIVTEEKKISSEKYIPNVIEPSFGLGRILYAVLEHSFQWSEKKTKTGELEQRVKLSIPALVAPVKVQILPLSAKEELIKYVDQFSDAFTKANLSSRVDASTAAIGRRYARADELGTPFAITIDFDTAKDNSVTLRERDSTQQIRIAIDKIVDVVTGLVRGNITWDKVYNTYPQVVRAAEDE